MLYPYPTRVIQAHAPLSHTPKLTAELPRGSACAHHALNVWQARHYMHSCEVTAAEFAPDGIHVVSGSADGRIMMWSTITGFKHAVLTLHTVPVRVLRFSQGACLWCGWHKMGWDDMCMCMWAPHPGLAGWLAGCIHDIDPCHCSRVCATRSHHTQHDCCICLLVAVQTHPFLQLVMLLVQ